MTFKNYYKILGIDSTATPLEIKASYRTLAKVWHPDKNTQLNAKNRFQSITEAYQTLSNPAKRQTYDLDYWGQVFFQEELQALQQDIDQMMQAANQRREEAHEQWMRDFKLIWTSKMAQA